MNKDDFIDFNNEILEFMDEEPDIKNLPESFWTVLIVDDDASVHQVTRMILEDFVFQGKHLNLISAYSITEAKEILHEHNNIPLVLLDVVMEEDDSGLKLVQYIREQMQNKLTRIILRTGQPGQAPERQVVINYDINDYKLKTELTADKLFVAVVSALRSYHDLGVLEANNRSLEQIFDSSVNIMRERRIDSFLEKSYNQINAILNSGNKKAQLTKRGAIIKKLQDNYIVSKCYGDFKCKDNVDIRLVMEEKELDLFNEVEQTNKSAYYDGSLFIVLESDFAKYYLYMYTDQILSNWDKNLIRILETTMSVTFNNLYLNNEIETTQKEIIFTLGEVAEARSEETGFHVKRVAEYSRLLAELVGLNEFEANLIEMAAPVHDLGKLAVPDNILNKPGRLNEEEFEIIKRHALAGYDMLKNSNGKILQMAAIIAGSHHEWWDGSGYPKGLKGEDIPISGRIVAIADVFDALGSDRVYKKAWPDEKIIEIFKVEKGTHFDPVLTDLFINNFASFVKIREDQSYKSFMNRFRL